MRSRLSFDVSNVFIRHLKRFYPQKTFLYSMNLVFTFFIFVNNYLEKHIETMKPHMITFDTAKESLDPILSLK